MTADSALYIPTYKADDQDVVAELNARFGAQTFTLQPSLTGMPVLWVPRERITEVLQFLRNLPRPYVMLYDLHGVDDLFTETTPYAPSSPYSASKASSDHLVRAWQRTYGLPVLITNCSNTYGPFHFPEKLIPLVILNALDGKPLPVYGDGSQTRSFCFVDDLVDGLCRLALSNELDPVNLGNPREQTIREFAEAVKKAAGGGGKLVFEPLPPGDPKQRRPDITRAKSILGWEPRVPLEVGLPKTIEYFRGLV